MRFVFSISLMVTFLAGVVGVNYNVHYCCGEEIVSKISFIPSSLSCGMTMISDSHNSNQGETIGPVCCENDHLAFEINDDYVKFDTQVQHHPKMDSVPMDVELAVSSQVNRPNYSELGYSPPPLDRDIVVLVQSFLI